MRMAHKIASWMRKGSSLLKPPDSSSQIAAYGGFQPATESQLFTKVDPSVDGDDCDHDCASCTIRYPNKFSIDEDTKLYGHVKGWSTHMIVATGKTDWVRDVVDEKGSVMEAVDKAPKPANGKLMLSASNIPTPDYADDKDYEEGHKPTSILLLPAFTIVDHVTPATTAELIRHIVSSAPTNTSPLPTYGSLNASSSSLSPKPTSDARQTEAALQPTSIPANLPFKTRPCPHDALILMCSHKTRDARCGQSAPLLRKEFERILRPLGLYRDMHDERPGGVGVYFINHVGGHKFSANVMVYRRAGMGWKGVVEGSNAVMTDGEADQNGFKGINGREDARGEAAQCIWLARVRPADCEGIIKFTVLQGKVVKPETQLRGGFDRERGLTSW